MRSTTCSQGFDEADSRQADHGLRHRQDLHRLKIAEQLARPAAGGKVLFLVPSISLLSQTLREWTHEATCRCAPSRSAPTPRSASSAPSATTTSGRTTSRSRPPPTRRGSCAQIETAASRRRGDDGGVLHLPVDRRRRARRRKQGLGEFDLIVCDEAHRTTGVTLAGEDESAFVTVHDDGYLRGDQAALHDRHAADLRRRHQGQGRRGRTPSCARWTTRRCTARSSTASGSARPSSRTCSPTTRCWSSPSTRSYVAQTFQAAARRRRTTS